MRAFAAESSNFRLRLRAEIDRLRQEVALLREEIHLKDARMARIPAQRRPHYLPVERMAILELRAARGWSSAQTAAVFQISQVTIREWMLRVAQRGTEGFLSLRVPVNKFPDFVRYAVERLKTLCPILGKQKIAQVLCRAGLHLAATTVRRMLREFPQCRPAKPDLQAKAKRVTAKRPNHVWHVDLTVVPTMAGFWTAWMPLALIQRTPFCYWVAVVVDHYSRRLIDTATWDMQPTGQQVRSFLGRAVHDAGKAPKYIICDKSEQFWNDGFKAWCKRKGIRPRFGAIGKHGSIAVVERFVRALKTECTRRILVPQRRQELRHELALFARWFNAYRPHDALDGCTPNEIYFRRKPSKRKPSLECRVHWPRGSPCAAPKARIKGKRGVQFRLHVRFLDGHKHLPIVTLRRAA